MSAKIIGRIPRKSSMLILDYKNGVSGIRPLRVEGYLIEEGDEIMGTCGVRGSIIIPLKEYDTQMLRENVFPLLLGSYPRKKREDGRTACYIEDGFYLRNDFNEPDYSI